MYNKICKAEIYCDGYIFPTLVEKDVFSSERKPSYSICNGSFGFDTASQLSLYDVICEDKDMSLIMAYRAEDAIILGCDSVILSDEKYDYGTRFYIDRSREAAAVFAGSDTIYAKNVPIKTMDFIKKIIEMSDALSIEEAYIMNYFRQFDFGDTVIDVVFLKDKIKYTFGDFSTNVSYKKCYSEEKSVGDYTINWNPIISARQIKRLMMGKDENLNISQAESFVRNCFKLYQNVYSSIRSLLNVNVVSPVGGDIHIITAFDSGKILLDGDENVV